MTNKYVELLTTRYKKENLFLLSESTKEKNNKIIFDLENELSLTDKMEIMDYHSKNKASKLLAILELWDLAKDELPRSNGGNINKISKKAWIKRNSNDLFFDELEGKYSLFGNNFTLSRYAHSNRGKFAYEGQHVILQWFNSLLLQLFREEVIYKNSIDPIKIKEKYVYQMYELYNGSFFEHEKLNDFYYNGLILKESELDEFVNIFKELENTLEKLKKDLKSVL